MNRMQNRNRNNTRNMQRNIAINHEKRSAINKNFRFLWHQQCVWTRSFIISTSHNLNDLQFVTTRFLKIPHDFSTSISEFYGEAKAENFEKLFTDHLMICAKLVNSIKSKNSKQILEDRDSWKQNALQISKFLNSINPQYWNAEEWFNLLSQYIILIENQATERLKGNYSSDVSIYSEIELWTSKMSDLMSSGIIKQFKI